MKPCVISSFDDVDSLFAPMTASPVYSGQKYDQTPSRLGPLSSLTCLLQETFAFIRLGRTFPAGLIVFLGLSRD